MTFDREVLCIVVTGSIVDCVMFNKGVVHIVVAGYIVNHYYIIFNRGVVHIIVTDYIVNHYYVMFNRGVVHIVVAVIILTIIV